MKKLYTLIVSLLIAQYSFAQWPANYGGVMLQGFYWDSFEDTKWQKLTSQVDEIAPYFNLIWVPNSGNCVSANSMGYMPVYWLDHKSSFGGRERYLTEMIAAYKEKGVGIIEDVVFNHKAPVGKNGSWIDFANESRTGIVNTDITYTLNWTAADICASDDRGATAAKYPNETFGANDEGEDFSGARDLDHTSANVQQNCKTYLDFLIKELGYVGFRLDMVKGYSAYYTKMYNEHAKPQFCVGERWSGYDDITGWVSGTGYTSAAFDFPLKFQINEAFGYGNWDKLKEQSLALNDNFRRYSVTFIDNHDTFRDENSERLRRGVLGANAFILAMPGTPCIFLKHWQRYPIAIGNMILARKAAGITNQSTILQYDAKSYGFILKTKGSVGEVLVLCGSATADVSGYKLIAQGEQFSYYVSNNVTVSGLRSGTDSNGEAVDSDITVYVDSEEAPYLYAWGNGHYLGDWPGALMTQQATVKDRTFWKHTFTQTPLNIIFNNGAGTQTSNIALAHDGYFTFDAGNSDKATNWTDITKDYQTGDDITLPLFVKPIEGHIYAYFRGNMDYDQPYAWVWGADDASFNKNTTWPGDKLTKVGKDGSLDVWLWDGGAIASGAAMPTNILFNNCGYPQTVDLAFRNGGYYNAYGFLADVTTDIQPVRFSGSTTVAPAYNLQGQRVADNYRGLVIKNGRKYISK
ncbi:MAG: starch-binding protein [Prevotella sp.]|nr:starch-binding protein [Prevotella sp.]